VKDCTKRMRKTLENAPVSALLPWNLLSLPSKTSCDILPCENLTILDTILTPMQPTNRATFTFESQKLWAIGRVGKMTRGSIPILRHRPAKYITVGVPQQMRRPPVPFEAKRQLLTALANKNIEVKFPTPFQNCPCMPQEALTLSREFSSFPGTWGARHCSTAALDATRATSS
jgi:hypothetical protein